MIQKILSGICNVLPCQHPCFLPIVLSNRLIDIPVLFYGKCCSAPAFEREFSSLLNIIVEISKGMF